jgi:large subunit ribosomal protein L17
MLTLGKRGDLHARRTALSYLKHKDIVAKLFSEIAPAAAARNGGYTRITKLGQRPTDSAPMAYIEWVDFVAAPAAEKESTEKAAEATAS